MKTSFSFDTFCDAVQRPKPIILQTGSFWEMEEPQFDENSMLVRGGMFEHQREWWNLPNFIKALIAGYGAGKTISGCKRILSLCLQNAPAPCAVVSPSFPLARNTVVSTLKELCAGKKSIYGRQFWWKYNPSTHEFKIRYKGRNAMIIIYSGDKPESLRGPNLGAALIDEPFIQEEEVFTQMIARIRHPTAITKELLLTGTPENISNFGYDIIAGDKKDRYDVGVVHASTRANKALSADYVKRLEGAYPDKAGQAYIEGKFVNLTTGSVFYAFDPDRHVVDLKIPDDAVLGAGMDFNVNPFAMCVFWRLGSHIHFIDEFELENSDTAFACSILKEKYTMESTKILKKHTLTTIYPDATGNQRKTSAPGGKTDFTYIREAGFIIDAPFESPKLRDSYNVVNGKFKPMVGESSITLSPKCKKIIKSLCLYSYENMHKQEALKHGLDAFRYPITYLFPFDKNWASTKKLIGA